MRYKIEIDCQRDSQNMVDIVWDSIFNPRWFWTVAAVDNPDEILKDGLARTRKAAEVQAERAAVEHSRHAEYLFDSATEKKARTRVKQSRTMARDQKFLDQSQG